AAADPARRLANLPAPLRATQEKAPGDAERRGERGPGELRGASAAAAWSGGLQATRTRAARRPPCVRRRAGRLAGPRECRRGREIGVMMIVDCSVGLEATSIVNGKLQE
ncbi:hypothetical protein A6R68_20913, partial [Neotoma lepida]